MNDITSKTTPLTFTRTSADNTIKVSENELPSWITNPENDIYIGVSFPGGNRAEALAMAETAMCFGTGVSCLFSSMTVSTSESENTVFDHFHSVNTLEIKTVLQYDIVREELLSSGEYAVAIRNGKNTTSHVLLEVSSSMHSNETSISDILLTYHGDSPEKALFWVRKLQIGKQTILQTSGGYYYSPLYSEPFSYQIEELLFDSSNGLKLSENKQYEDDNGQPVSSSILFAPIEPTIRNLFSSGYITSHETYKNGSSNYLTINNLSNKDIPPLKYFGICNYKGTDGHVLRCITLK